MLLGAQLASAQMRVDVQQFHTGADDTPLWHITRIQQDDNGLIWIATWNGLYRYDGTQFFVFKAEPGNGTDMESDRVRDILMIGGDTLLCRVEDERIWAFNVKTCRFDTIPTRQQRHYRQVMNEGLTDMIVPTADVELEGQHFQDIKQHFIDQQGNHWLVNAYNIYCVRISKRRGEMIDPTQDKPMQCIGRDLSGNFWLCERESSAVSICDKDFNHIGYLSPNGLLQKQPVKLGRCYDVYDDKTGDIWLGAKPEGLFRVRRHGSRCDVLHFVPAMQGGPLPTDAVYDIKRDESGRLWLATFGHGIICIENADADDFSQMRFISLSAECPQYPADAIKVRSLRLMGDGTMLATTTVGLLVIDDLHAPVAELTMRLHKREMSRGESLTSNATLMTKLDDSGRLFVATENGGVNLLESPDIHAEQLSWRHFTVREGLTSDICTGLQPWDLGRMLVTCHNGVTVIDADRGEVESYGHLFWNTPASFSECPPLLTPANELVMSLDDGLLRVSTASLNQQGYAPHIALSSLTIGSEPTRYDADGIDTLWLAPQQRTAIISYAAIDFRSHNNLRYRTRMTPNTEWSRPSNMHEMLLQDLRPGTYTLEICSSNADGQWTNNTRRLTIIVEPTFFETWYGQLLQWLIFAIIIAIITINIQYARTADKKRKRTLEAYLKLLETTKEQEARASANQSDPQTAPAGTPAPVQITAVTESAGEDSAMTHEDTVFMQRLMTYVEQNLSNCDANVSDMADATATSKSSLARKTHKLMGVTPADLLKMARMKHACQLLSTTNSLLSDISLDCGFSDPKYFSRCFKATIGMTPTEYRNTH